MLALVIVWCSLAVELDRPHERWALYRKYQRILELERTQFRYKIGDYRTLEEAERLEHLTERLCAIELELHNEWEQLMPSRGEVASAIGRLRVTNE